MNTNQRNLLAALSLCAAVVPNLATAIAVSGQGTWESTLQGRDLDGNLATFEAYYDTVLNITWLADANYANTSGYDSDGYMTWSTAVAWATSLNPYGSGITGWRLPTTVDVGNDGATYGSYGIYQAVDYGYNITSHSEMSYMFYETLGNIAYYDTSGIATGCTAPNYCLSNTGPFSNLQPNNYWSVTEEPYNTNYAWDFSFSHGYQSNFHKAYSLNTWAVHAGDVGASAVPVPTAAWLFGSGLLGLVGIARRKKSA